MSFDQNRKDFEDAIYSLKDAMEGVDGIIHDDLITKVSNVITEYEGHYISNIDELIEERDELQNQLDEIPST